MNRRLLTILLTVAITGCGNRIDLKPNPGHALPEKPLFAPTTPSPQQLVTPYTQARPQRGDEELNRTQERRGDKFDLPPAG